jgi:hypothetical protein
MEHSETKTYSFDITLTTCDGELPTDAEVRQLVEDQMRGELDDTTGLMCIDVTLEERNDSA